MAMRYQNHSLNRAFYILRLTPETFRCGGLRSPVYADVMTLAESFLRKILLILPNSSQDSCLSETATQQSSRFSRSNHTLVNQ